MTPSQASPVLGTSVQPPRHGDLAVRRDYVYHVDVVRLVTFVCVVGVHAITSTMNPQSIASGAVVSLMHFTRGAFFVLTAFVLTYVYSSAPLRVRPFWGRRFLYVGVPYVVWTVVYWWVALRAMPQPADLCQLGIDLVTGTGNYHLYFLLVSLQLYLLFPVLLWLVRRARGHHVALVVVSGAVELGLMALAHYPHWPGPWSTLQANVLVLSPMYQFYFVVGALAAVHHERLRTWVRQHPRAVVGALVGTAAVHVGVYLGQLSSSGSVARAYDPLQPSVVPWTVAVTLGLYAWGCFYAARRQSGSRLARFVDLASVTSFGVFLVHPLFLNTLLGPWLAWGYSSLDPTVSGALAWVGTLLLSFAFAVVVLRTPLALPLAGRHRIRATRTAASP